MFNMNIPVSDRNRPVVNDIIIKKPIFIKKRNLHIFATDYDIDRYKSEGAPKYALYFIDNGNIYGPYNNDDEFDFSIISAKKIRAIALRKECYPLQMRNTITNTLRIGRRQANLEICYNLENFSFGIDPDEFKNIYHENINHENIYHENANGYFFESDRILCDNICSILKNNINLVLIDYLNDINNAEINDEIRRICNDFINNSPSIWDSTRNNIKNEFQWLVLNGGAFSITIINREVNDVVNQDATRAEVIQDTERETETNERILRIEATRDIVLAGITNCSEFDISTVTQNVNRGLALEQRDE